MFSLKYPTATSPSYQLGIPETLGHFLTFCLRFCEALTEAHNRCWRAIVKTLVGILPNGLQVHIDKPMSDTDLLGPPGEPPKALPALDGAPIDAQGSRSTLNLMRLRPGRIAIIHALKDIAILHHNRYVCSVNRDQTGPNLDSIAPLGSELGAGREDDAETGSNGRATALAIERT
jgi:hypothetical protein